MRQAIRVFTVALLLGNFVSAFATPLIPNPSFETPGHSDLNPFVILSTGSTLITGWTVGGSGVDYFRNAVSTFASDGLYSVNYVRGPGEGGSISTTISGLLLGTTYDLFFDSVQSDLSAGAALTAIVDTTSQSYINIATNVFETKSLRFLAGGTTAALTFAGPATGAIDASFAHVDNVTIRQVVNTVPVPGSLTLLAGGILALLGLGRRRGARWGGRIA